MKQLIGILALGALFILIPSSVSAHGSTSHVQSFNTNKHGAVVRDTTPPKILSLHIQSNNTDPTKAVTGDKVTISFTANESVTPIVLVESKALFAKATNSGGNSWDASYTVSSKDHQGKVNYIITLVDASHNIYVCSSVRLPFISTCPTTDGSSVTVSHTAPPPSDTTAPVVQVSDMLVDADDASGATVDFDPAPVALDETDGSVPVSCTPASGSHFPIGVTTVTCTAQDAANNVGTGSFTVTVNPFVPPDNTPPDISEHDDVAVETGEGSGAVVTYDLPTATDDTDPSPDVACTPESGSTFVLGDTEVTCTATDAAGNSASTSFTVTVTFVPQPFVMASSDANASTLCSPDFRTCYTDGGPDAVIDLGQGSDLQGGTIQSVTIAKDESTPYSGPLYPWRISIYCYTDVAHTTSCPDWVQPNAYNLNTTNVVTEIATTTSDNKYWTAYFTDPAHEANYNGSAPVTFNPAYYYTLDINDNGIPIKAYGSATEPYWVLTGMTTP